MSKTLPTVTFTGEYPNGVLCTDVCDECGGCLECFNHEGCND